MHSKIYVNKCLGSDNLDIDLSKYVQKNIISSRFILALLVIIGLIVGKVEDNVAYIILAFYFGNTTKGMLSK